LSSEETIEDEYESYVAARYGYGDLSRCHDGC
jgi:hypothetical protein